MAFPIIPFAKLPRKYWDDQAEKKGRIEVIDPPSSEEEEDEVVSIASSSSSEYDLIQHLQDLLPGDLVDGQKPNKAANTAHLDDLKVQKKRVDRLKYVKQAYHFLKTFRERERERRKHYILAEFEQKVKAYDEMCRKKIQDELDAHEKATKLEAHRRLERIKRNSKKRVEKKELADRFTKDLYLREREAKQMQFYVDYFPKWKHEGMDREDEEAILFQQLCKQQAEANEKERKRQERIDLIENDRLKLEDDKQMTEGVERIMLRYGTLHYSNQTEFTDDERINRIFKKSKDYNKKKKQVQIQEQEKKDAAAASMRSESVEELMDMPKTARSQASEFTYSTEATDFTISTVDKLLLQLDSKANLEELYRDLRKNKHKRGKSTKYKNPFANKSAFFDTGDVTKVKGYHIKEVGAMAFAIELSTGLCPLLEEVCLKDCQMYDDGFGRVIQGMKTANLYTLRVMDVRGNFLTHKALDYMYEISKAGIFSSLEVFNLANNELGDDGIDSLSRILMIYTLQNLKEIHFQRNRVTDHGFQKIVKVMMAIQPEHYPQFHRLGLENNVVSSFVKQELAPIPFYVSV